MRAARFYGKEDIRVEEIEEPAVREGWIKIKPAFVGICGTGTSLLPKIHLALTNKFSRLA
jgi:threonine dehydrogenase-like Zn-dependent dehydrogenase